MAYSLKLDGEARDRLNTLAKKWHVSRAEVIRRLLMATSADGETLPSEGELLGLLAAHARNGNLRATVLLADRLAPAPKRKPGPAPRVEPEPEPDDDDPFREVDELARRRRTG